jgi:hypothetical protein
LFAYGATQQKSNVAQEHDLVLRQVGDDVAPGAQGREPELHFRVAEEVAHIVAEVTVGDEHRAGRPVPRSASQSMSSVYSRPL